MCLMKERALEAPRRDNTCASMGKFEKIGPKSRLERCFLMIFFGFFPEAPGTFPREDLEIFESFLMPWSSGKLPGMILDEFGELHFFMKILKKMVPKISTELQAFRHAHSIDLRFETWNQHHNNILQNEKTMGAQTIFAIFRNQCKWTPNYPKRLNFLPIWLALLWPRITL